MKYEIKKIKNNIIALVIPDNYDRAMMFCRVQEFYESPNSKFRDKKFSVWDFFSWYSHKHGKGCFSYPKDFVGYNVPLIVAKKCYELNSKPETPYDEEMMKLINSLFENGTRKYLMGVDTLDNPTFNHELAHALYYTDLEYKDEMDLITNSISKSNLRNFKKNLKSIGYCSSVIKDEIQAYMATEKNKRVTKGIVNKSKLRKKYSSIFRKYKSDI